MVTVLPFTVTSQKRSVKGKNNQSSESVSKQESTFMIIKGVELMLEDSKKVEKISEEEESAEYNMKRLLKPLTKLMVTFDFGSVISKENQSLQSHSRNFRTMADAANKATEYGWEFINSTVVVDGKATLHFYYMKKK